MKRPSSRATRCTLCLCAVAAAGDVAAGASMPRLYQMTTETGMPHLEDNLRYAVVHERRCMSTSDLSTAFWMLRDVSLQDCKLVKTSDEAGAAAYALTCTGGHGTSGSAKWQLEPAVITGTLEVRLGGKNMTFYQRVTARPIGQCEAAVPGNSR